MPIVLILYICQCIFVLLPSSYRCTSFTGLYRFSGLHGSGQACMYTRIDRQVWVACKAAT